MKKEDFKSWDVQELISSELKSINGGEMNPFWTFLGKATGITTLISAIVYVVDNWDKVEEGWQEGCAAGEKLFQDGRGAGGSW